MHWTQCGTSQQWFSAVPSYFSSRPFGSDDMFKWGSAVVLDAFCSHGRGDPAGHYGQQVDLLLVSKLIIVKQIKGLLCSRLILQSNQRIPLIRSKQDGEMGLGAHDPDGQSRALQVAAVNMILSRQHSACCWAVSVQRRVDCPLCNSPATAQRCSYQACCSCRQWQPRGEVPLNTHTAHVAAASGLVPPWEQTGLYLHR